MLQTDAFLQYSTSHYIKAVSHRSTEYSVAKNYTKYLIIGISYTSKKVLYR